MNVNKTLSAFLSTSAPRSRKLLAICTAKKKKEKEKFPYRGSLIRRLAKIRKTWLTSCCRLLLFMCSLIDLRVTVELLFTCLWHWKANNRRGRLQVVIMSFIFWTVVKIGVWKWSFFSPDALLLPSSDTSRWWETAKEKYKKNKCIHHQHINPRSQNTLSFFFFRQHGCYFSVCLSWKCKAGQTVWESFVMVTGIELHRNPQIENNIFLDIESHPGLFFFF